MVVLSLARHLFSRERRALTLAQRSQCWAETAVGRQARAGARLHRRRRRCIWQSRTGDHRLFPLRQARRCERCIAQASAIMISPRSRTGCAGSDGRAYLTDFQLAACFKSRSRLFRIAAYEDLAASPETQAQLRARCADGEGAQDPRAQVGGGQRLAQDRQEGLSGHHPRPVQFHRPRGRRQSAWSTTRPC